MRLHDAGPGGRWLSYCTNVHAAETLADIRESLLGFTVPLARRFSPAPAPFGVGLRLGESSVADLAAPRALADFRDFLAANRLSVFTLNVFPQRSFHAPVVKETVYAPEWGTNSREVYTLAAARVLAALRPDEDPYGTMSTVPVGFGRPEASRDLRLASGAASLVRTAQALARLEADTGRRIQLLLEPEPACLVATIDGMVAFFRDTLAKAARAAGLDEALVPRYLGVCVDACHAAVEYDDPESVFSRLADAGIEVGKIQISNAIEIRRPGRDGAALSALRAFDEPRFLHQVTARTEAGALVHFEDLPPFLRWLSGAAPEVESARCHFHVPVHLERTRSLQTTREALVRLLAAEARCPRVRHFEVETYTFDVLPDEARFERDLVLDLAAELADARRLLDA